MSGRFGEFVIRHHRLSGLIGAVAHRTTGPWRWRAQAGHCWYCDLTVAGIDRIAPEFRAEADAAAKAAR